MLVNIAIDALLGAIPLLGDVFDFAFKANEKNLALIERHRGDPTQPATWGDRLVVFGVVLVALALRRACRSWWRAAAGALATEPVSTARRRAERRTCAFAVA